jgi:hypothetical protein
MSEYKKVPALNKPMSVAIKVNGMSWLLFLVRRMYASEIRPTASPKPVMTAVPTTKVWA